MSVQSAPRIVAASEAFCRAARGFTSSVAAARIIDTYSSENTLTSAPRAKNSRRTPCTFVAMQRLSRPSSATYKLMNVRLSAADQPLKSGSATRRSAQKAR